MQVSWIDAHQVTALAEGLRRAPTKSPLPSAATQSVATSLVDDSAAFVFPEELEEPLESLAEVIVESDSPPPMVDFRARLQAIRERAVSAGLIPAKAPAPPEELHLELPPFQPRTGAVSARLAAFIDWAQPALVDAEIFIVDDQGDLHWGTPATAGLALSAIMAWSAASRMSALAACETPEPLRQVLATGRHLAVIPCPTPLGIMHVAITSLALVPQAQILVISQALTSAMDANDE